MKITHSVRFDFALSLKKGAATDFVRDAETSLSKVTFIQHLETFSTVNTTVDTTLNTTLDPVDALEEPIKALRAQSEVTKETANETTNETTVRARIPVNAALFGQQELAFESRLLPTPRGAVLRSVPLKHLRPGWAEVAGEAEVRPHPEGSHVSYRFDIAIHLHLPEPERWGGRALLKMIHFTAERVLESITAEFPGAVQAAAREVEASYQV